jgi:hypothetical protein
VRKAKAYAALVEVTVGMFGTICMREMERKAVYRLAGVRLRVSFMHASYEYRTWPRRLSR